MNLNASINFKNIDPKALLRFLIRHKSFLTSLVVIGLFGYTAYQISLITSVGPDGAYLNSQRQSLTSIQLKASPQLVQKLRQLQSAGDTSIPINTGKQNPFSLH